MRVFGHRLFPIAVLALLGIGAYWNSLHAPFAFDDIDSVERNPIVRFATQPYRHSPRSLLFLTFAFNNWLNGQNPFGYHIVNLVLHILNGLIVFAIARRIYNASNSQPSPGASRPLVALAFLLEFRRDRGCRILLVITRRSWIDSGFWWTPRSLALLSNSISCHPHVYPDSGVSLRTESRSRLPAICIAARTKHTSCRCSDSGFTFRGMEMEEYSTVVLLLHFLVFAYAVPHIQHHSHTRRDF